MNKVIVASLALVMTTLISASGPVNETKLETVGRFIDNNAWLFSHLPVGNSPIFGSRWPSQPGTIYQDFDSYASKDIHIQDVKKSAGEYKLKSATVWEQPLGKDIQVNFFSDLHLVMLAMIGFENTWFGDKKMLKLAQDVDGSLWNLQDKLMHWFLVCVFERDGKEIYVKVQRNIDGIRAECVSSAEAPASDTFFGNVKPHTVDNFADVPAKSNKTLEDVLRLCESQAKPELRYNVLYRNCQHFTKYVHDSVCRGPALGIPMDTDVPTDFGSHD